MKTLSHKGLPVFMDEFQNDDFVCIVREYVEGTPLDRYTDGRKLTHTQAVTLCIKLCDILIYLHGFAPPIIHRDVKPQNIIVRDNGEICLIDFDIARTYDAEAKTDTQFVGTRTYAPPEQYGFSQTDCRTDVYSLGVLLRFLLTGNEDAKKSEIANKRLSRIVCRCTAFSPEERFPNAAAVKNALNNSDGHREKRMVHILCITAVVLLALCVGFTVGRYTKLFTSRPIVEGVRFAEPLIEQAVRVQLGKDETEDITAEDLLAVREIYIFGGEVSKTDEPFSEGLGGRLRDTPRGDLMKLEDVKLLPNLEVLYINYQTLAEISPLAELKHLTTVSLRSTYVEDISALSNMDRLSALCLFDTCISDMSPLGFCPALFSLDVGNTPLTSLDALPDIPDLKFLSLRQTQIPSLDGINRYAQLEELDLCRSEFTDLSPLLSLQSLQKITLDEPMRAAAEALGSPPFEVKYE